MSEKYYHDTLWFHQTKISSYFHFTFFWLNFSFIFIMWIETIHCNQKWHLYFKRQKSNHSLCKKMHKKSGIDFHNVVTTTATSIRRCKKSADIGWTFVMRENKIKQYLTWTSKFIMENEITLWHPSILFLTI